MNTEIRSKKKSPRDADYESLMNMVMKFVSGSNGLWLHSIDHWHKLCMCVQFLHIHLLVSTELCNIYSEPVNPKNSGGWNSKLHDSLT